MSHLLSYLPLLIIMQFGDLLIVAHRPILYLYEVQRAKLRVHPTIPSLLYQALSKTPVPISKQITANVKLADSGIKIKIPSTFKVAPLATHEVIFGMPFLAENNLLIDPVARKLLSVESRGLAWYAILCKG